MLDQLDRTFAALADPSRRALLVELARGPVEACDLAERCGLTRAELLAHLVALAEAGLVTSAAQHGTRTVACTPDALEAATAWLADRGLARRHAPSPKGSALDVLFGGPVVHLPRRVA